MRLPAPHVVSFDVGRPLRCAGIDARRRARREASAAYAGPIDYALRDLHVTTDGDLAFVHSINRVNGTLVDGHATDLWLRWTACVRRSEGAWLVVHDHVSLPADLRHEAVPHLTP